MTQTTRSTPPTRRPTVWRIAPTLFWIPILSLLVFFALRRDWGAGGEAIPAIGIGVIVVALLPLGRRIAARYRGDTIDGPIPFLPILGVIFAIYYGLPVLIQDRMAIGDFATIPMEAVRWSAIVSLVGWLALLVAYRVTSKWAVGAPLRLAWDPERAQRLGIAMMIVGATMHLFPSLQVMLWGAGQLGSLLRSFLQLGLGILFVLHLQGKLRKPERILLFGIGLPFLLFTQVGTGSTANVAYVALFFAMITWSLGRRVPLGWVLVAALALALLRSSANEFRERAWYAPDAHLLTHTDKTRIFLEIAGGKLLGHESAYAPSVTDQITRVMRARTNQLATLGHVVDWTPRVVPYWGGETYRTLAASFVPRLLWPEKPSKIVGQEFGHRYRILAPGDRTTSINLPLLVEFYANFGTPGVIVGMALLGILYRLFDRKFNHATSGPAAYLIAAQIMTRLSNIESDFSLTFGAILYQVVVFYFLFRWFASPVARRQLAPTRRLVRPVRTRGLRSPAMGPRG